MEERIATLRRILDGSAYTVALCGSGMMEEGGFFGIKAGDRAYEIEQKYGYSQDEIFTSSFYTARPMQFFEFYREEMLKNFSSSQIQPGHNIQGCISALSAAIQARSHTETEQALDQLAQSLLAFSSMHHFHSIFPMYLKNEPAFHQENTEICPYTIRLHRYRACKNILRPVSGKNGGFS